MPSARAARISQAEIRAMSIECAKVGGINLAQGVCDTPVPPAVASLVQAAVNEGYNSYSRYDGIPELRQTIADHLRTFNGIDADPEREIIAGPGSTASFYAAGFALLEPGDEVILFEPFYGYHYNTLIALDAVPVAVPMTVGSWEIDWDRLAAAITPNCKAIVINTPVNPCGKVFTREEIGRIGALAERHDLIIFTDEIYEHFIYAGEHVSPASVDGLRDRTVTISGYSKLLSITGWRIGFAVAKPEWADTIGYVSDLIYVCAPTPLQRAVAKGLPLLGREFYEQLTADHQKKRDQICGVLSAAGLTPHVPDGAYYVLADVSGVPGGNAKERAMNLLHETGVAGVPGSAFYADGGGENLIRFCFAKPDQELDQAIDRLAANLR